MSYTVPRWLQEGLSVGVRIRLLETAVASHTAFLAKSDVRLLATKWPGGLCLCGAACLQPCSFHTPFIAKHIQSCSSWCSSLCVFCLLPITSATHGYHTAFPNSCRKQDICWQSVAWIHWVSPRVPMHLMQAQAVLLQELVCYILGTYWGPIFLFWKTELCWGCFCPRVEGKSPLPPLCTADPVSAHYLVTEAGPAIHTVLLYSSSLCFTDKTDCWVKRGVRYQSILFLASDSPAGVFRLHSGSQQPSANELERSNSSGPAKWLGLSVQFLFGFMWTPWLSVSPVSFFWSIVGTPPHYWLCFYKSLGRLQAVRRQGLCLIHLCIPWRA